MRPPLLPLALALLTAVPPRAQQGPEVTAEAGLNVSLPCNLPGPSLSWQWVLCYPVCAGVRGGIQTICTVMAAKERHIPLGRFRNRLHLLLDQGTQTSVLEFRPPHMNDSGVFFCASPSQNATMISVTITPGSPAGAPIAAVPKERVRKGAVVSFSCTPCGAQGPSSPSAGGAMWGLNREPPPNSPALRILSSKLLIEDFSRRFEGLWSCCLPEDPSQSGGYCLEHHPGAHGIQQNPPPGPTPPPSPGSAPGSGWGVMVLAVRCGLAFLFLSATLGAVGYVHWKTRARPASRPQRD